MIPRILAVALLAGGLLVALAPAPGMAQSTNGTADDDCLVTQAADAAQQRQLAMLDAAKVNPQDFFSGPQSCISSSLLQSFDLSNLIPDLAGMLTGGIGNLINSVIQQAQQQVCSVLNDQLRGVVQNLNSVTGQFDNSLSSQLRGVMGSGSVMRAPSYASYGQYNFSQPTSYGSVLGSTPQTVSSGVQPMTSQTVQPQSYSYTPSSSSGFGSTLFGQ